MLLWPTKNSQDTDMLKNPHGQSTCLGGLPHHVQFSKTVCQEAFIPIAVDISVPCQAQLDVKEIARPLDTARSNDLDSTLLPLGFANIVVPFA